MARPLPNQSKYGEKTFNRITTPGRDALADFQSATVLKREAQNSVSEPRSSDPALRSRRDHQSDGAIQGQSIFGNLKAAPLSSTSDARLEQIRDVIGAALIVGEDAALAIALHTLDVEFLTASVSAEEGPLAPKLGGPPNQKNRKAPNQLCELVGAPSSRTSHYADRPFSPRK